MSLSTPPLPPPTTSSHHPPSIAALLPSFIACSALCPVGEYVLHECSESRPSVCWPCPAGYYCNGSTKLPVACPTGTWSIPFSYKCSKCSECESGINFKSLHCTNVSDTVCTPCPRGYDCSNVDFPMQCPSNTYSVGEKGCVECPESHVSPPGSYSKLSCVCEHEINEATKECMPCPRTSIISNNKCVDCPSGFQCLDRMIEICPANTYSRDAQCVQCPQHSLSDEGSSDVTQCVCHRGYIPAKQQCVPCGNGTYYDSITQTCIPCEQGFFCVGKTHREKCPVNTFSMPRSTICTHCPLNSQCSNCADAASCVCSPGFELSHGNGTCVRCAPSSYNLEANATCRDCSKGHCCKGGSFIEQCGVGTFSRGKQAACTACDECSEVTVSKCNTSHNSVCANLVEPIARIHIRQSYSLGNEFSLTLHTFSMYAMILSSILPHSQLISICSDGDDCIHCFQGVCPDNSTYETLAVHRQHFIIDMQLESHMDQLKGNMNGLQNKAFMLSSSQTAMRKTVPYYYQQRDPYYLQHHQRDDEANHTTYNLETSVIYRIVCPAPLVWDNYDCIKYVPSQKGYVMGFMSLCVFIGLSSAVFIQRRKASYATVAQQM